MNGIRPDSPAAAAAAAAAGDAEPTPAKKRVVVIDDSELVLDSVAAALSDLGCEVSTMLEPSQRELCDSPPDLVLIDVNMPQAYGDDLTCLFKEAWGITAPIVLYSSLPEHVLRRRAREVDADGYICKSWGVESLKDQIGAILELDRAGDDEGRGGGFTRVRVTAGGGRRKEWETVGPEDPRHDPGDGPGDGLGDGPGECPGDGPVPDGDAAIARSIYDTFAARCRDRQRRLVDLLEGQDRGADTPPQMDEVCREMHDWIGEAKLLGLDGLAAAAVDLREVLRRWERSFIPSLNGPQLRRWIGSLADASQRVAAEAPSVEGSQVLRALHEELEREREDLSFTSTNTPVDLAERPKDRRHRRILVFDDSPIVCAALSEELQSRGHEVALASELADFERRLVDFRPEIIFLDIQMPEINGDDLCKKLRRQVRTRHVPIVFLSSLTDDALARLASSAAASGYLSKRRGMTELVKYLDDLLAQVV